LSCPFGAQGTVRAKQSLDHASPWVREAARRIVAAGGAEMSPEATKRLAAAPEPGARFKK
jgi:hypothetical protein